MHVVFDARYLNGKASGIGTYMLNLLREMLSLDEELRFTLVTRTPGLAAQFDAERCMDLVFDAPPRSFRTIHRLGAAVRSVPHDLFHGSFNILPARLRHSSVVTIHDVMQLQDPANIYPGLLDRYTAGAFWRRYIARAIQQADHLLTVSDATKKALLDLFPERMASEITVTPLGTDPFFGERPTEAERAEARTTIGTEAPVVLIVGNESPHKNHERAVRAFLQTFAPDDPVRLVLVRRSVRRDPAMRALLAGPEAQQRVVVLGHVSREVLRALYYEARIVFFPSWAEGFGLPILEGMAAGTPVVTSDRGAMAEVAGDAALLTSPFDVPAMAEALRRAHTDEALRERLIARGHERAATFTWRRCAEATLAAYRQVLGR